MPRQKPTPIAWVRPWPRGCRVPSVAFAGWPGHGAPAFVCPTLPRVLAVAAWGAAWSPLAGVPAAARLVGWQVVDQGGESPETPLWPIQASLQSSTAVERWQTRPAGCRGQPASWPRHVRARSAGSPGQGFESSALPDGGFPGRSTLKKHKPHTALSGCDRLSQSGMFQSGVGTGDGAMIVPAGGLLPDSMAWL